MRWLWTLPLVLIVVLFAVFVVSACVIVIVAEWLIPDDKEPKQ
jgi:hypothetical protein